MNNGSSGRDADMAEYGNILTHLLTIGSALGERPRDRQHQLKEEITRFTGKNVELHIYSKGNSSVLQLPQTNAVSFPVQYAHRTYGVLIEEIEDSSVLLFEPQHDEQTQKRVYHLLHLLPERERRVLILRYFQEYSMAEIGEELGLHVGHVRVLHLRALRHAALLETKERSLSPMDDSTNEPVTTYTERGQRVLDFAKEEALSFHHYYIGTEHLLLGILREGSAAALLVSQGATLSRIRAELLSVIGKNEPDSRVGAAFTPRSQRILILAGEIARKQGETAISPEHILQAIVGEKYGIAVQMLQSIGVGLRRWQGKEAKPSPEKNEQYIRQVEERIAREPQLDEEEERRLAHLVARGRSEQRRAELLKETPDAHLVEEGDTAYFRLIPASQHLVLSVAKEYFGPERDAREIINAGNDGLSVAAATFGPKKQTTFRVYARHMIHLQIIDALGCNFYTYFIYISP